MWVKPNIEARQRRGRRGGPECEPNIPNVREYQASEARGCAELAKWDLITDERPQSSVLVSNGD